MANRRPAWVSDLAAFVGFTLLNAAFCCLGIRLLGGSGAAPEGEAWMWVFAFPYKAALHFGWGTFTRIPLLVVGPLFYGLIWWGIWKAAKLFRVNHPFE